MHTSRLTLDESNDVPFDWTPDGKSVIYASDRNGPADIFKQEIGRRIADVIVSGPGHKWVPAVSADGAWILYLAYPPGKDFPTAEGTLMRIPVNGGATEPVMKCRPGSIVQCSRASLCVLDERSDDGKQLVFFAFDPIRGKQQELTRVGVGLNKFYNWTVSRDGAQIALIVPGGGSGHIRVLSLRGGSVQDVIVTGCGRISSSSMRRLTVKDGIAPAAVVQRARSFTSTGQVTPAS